MGRDGAAPAFSEDDRRARLAGVADRIRPTMLAREQRLPVLPALEALVPGLRRGSTLSVDGPAATSLALALAAGPSQDGAWVAAVGFPSLGLLAAAELSVALERLVLVADPGDDGDAAVWPAVVAALVDAFEVVLVHAGERVRAADGRRLVARTRERGAVLVQVGGSRPTRATWPEGADVALTVAGATWEGLGEGHGHLRARRVTVEAGGRRDAARPRRAELWLPSADGVVEAVLPEPVRLHERREPA
ncbi:MAG TPA: hypothetical protein VFV42_06800 [Acidimicrobiales bacterium]|nr:hypothetical protein [Acidimicrobiales bacterium]